MLSGEVFQNELLLEDVKLLLTTRVWTNQAPPNDGGLSLGAGGFRMHELSIAMSIVEMAEEQAARRGGVQVSAVHLKLCPLSGVAKEALLSCFDLACEDSLLTGCRLIINESQGRELEVTALEIQ